jgi:hypothetical protein
MALLGLTSCPRFEPVDVNFDTDPRVLRGAYIGKLEYDCLRRASIVAWKPDGSKAAMVEGHSFGQNPRLSVWTANPPKKILEMSLSGIPRLVVWNATLDQLSVASSYETTVERFDASTGTRLGKASLPDGVGEVVALSPDGRTILTQRSIYENNTDGVVQAWEGSTGALLWSKNLGREPSAAYNETRPVLVRAVTFDASGSRLAFAYRDTLQILKPTDGSLLASSTQANVTALHWKGEALSVAYYKAPNFLVARLDGSSLNKLREVTLAQGLTPQAFSADGNRAAATMPLYDTTPANKQVVRVWNLETGAVEREWTLELRSTPRMGSEVPAQIHGFTPDNTSVLLDGTTRTCSLETTNVGTGATQAAFTFDTPEVGDVEFVFQSVYENETRYTLIGSVSGFLLGGYAISGSGFGGDCYPKTIGGPTTCDRWVRPQTSLLPPNFGRASLALTKAGAPDVRLEISPSLTWVGVPPPLESRYGLFVLGQKQYWVNITPATR